MDRLVNDFISLLLEECYTTTVKVEPDYGREKTPSLRPLERGRKEHKNPPKNMEVSRTRRYDVVIVANELSLWWVEWELMHNALNV